MEVTPQPEESLSPPVVALTDQVLYFSQSTYELSEEVKTSLDAISKTLLAQPQTKLQITGHTDNVGESDKNLILIGIPRQSSSELFGTKRRFGKPIGSRVEGSNSACGVKRRGRQ